MNIIAIISDVDIINREPSNRPSSVTVTLYLNISSLAVCNVDCVLHKDRLQ